MRFLRPVCAALFVFLIAIAMNAQVVGTGAYPFVSLDNRGLDSINLGNLNTRFTIPIISKQGRGQPFNYSIQYEGLIWQTATSGGTTTWVPDPTWGFSGLLNGTTFSGYLTYSQTNRSCPRPPNYSGPVPPAHNINRYTYRDPYGATHLFNYSITGACPLGNGDDQVNGDGSTSDGSGYSLVNGYQVRTRSGAIITPAYSATGQDNTDFTDSNGNQIKGTANGVFTDTLGVNALTISGGNPKVFTYPVALQANGASTASANITYQTYNVQTNFQCSGIGEYGSNQVQLVNRVTLADGSFYGFTYESTPGIGGAVTGRLASITLPTGGTINYAYSQGGCNGSSGINADGTPGNLSRTTSDGTRSYGRGPINSNATFTNLQDEKGNQTQYQFTIASGLFYETSRKVSQGQATYTSIHSQATCYNGAQPNCDGALITLPITEVVFSNFTTGLIVDNHYDSGSQITQSKQSTSSTLLLTINNTYNSLEELVSTNTSDSAGHIVSSSTFGYDENSPTGTSGLPQHIAASGTRGNQTSSHISTGSGTIDTTTTYYDTGAPKSTSTPNGTTYYSYDSTQTFVTQTTLPTPYSGVSLTTGATYDQQSGVLTSTTGMNAGETTQITQYNAVLQPTFATPPNGSAIGVFYNSPTSTGYVHSIGNGTNQDLEVLLDGYGRRSRTALQNGQSANPWYQNDFCYDATGLLQFQPYRYQGAGWSTSKQCSGNGTAYTYDALGRITTVVTPDGTATYQYQGSAVAYTDVNGIQKITQYDALGRLLGVCEISSNGSLPGASGSPVSCGMDIAGTGFLTSYTYDLANHKTTIQQGVQQRIIQTDSAGRTILTSEPERGQTTYSYSYNSLGLQVIRARARANQTNPAILTHTTTQYDSLGRITSVSYDDGLTSTSNFYYDAPVSIGWTQTPTNTKGLLVNATKGATRLQLGYDIAGHVTNMSQCAPSICGTSSQESRPSLQFVYDSVGNLTYEFDGASGGISYGRSPAGEITSVTNGSYTGTYNPANLVSNVVNGPNGPVSYSLGNGLNISSTYDGLGRPSGGYVVNGASNQQLYGWVTATIGSQVTNMCDTVINQCQSHGYDEFNRLIAVSGGNSSYTYSYDRFGNRTQQTSSPIGPAPSYSFDPATNRIQGMSYDAAGNVANDGFHSYTYDAEGNVLSVDNGNTAQYVYDAMNHRVQAPTNYGLSEFLYDPFGHRTSTWIVANNFGNEGRIYMDDRQIAFRDYDGKTYFDHQDWLGTERMRTDPQGQIADVSRSLVYGDGFADSASPNADQDNYHFAGLDHDNESNTDNAQFRQYSPTQGRWMSPDPYDGSYDASDPQSLNRYSYVGNNPLSFTDPSGLVRPCNGTPRDGDGGCTTGGGSGPPPPIGCFPYCYSGIGSGPTPPQQPPPVGTGGGGGRRGGKAPSKAGCPAVPKAPSGANVNQNMAKAKIQGIFNPLAPLWFYNQVNYGGPMDYKTQGAQYEDFGNFNYGATGTAAYAPAFTLLRAAGWAQRGHPSSPQFGGNPGSLPSMVLNPFGGTAPYGDDPHDQQMIQQGIQYARMGCGG